MSGTKSTWVGTGRSSAESAELGSLDREFTEDGVFESAQPLTVQFRGAMVRSREDSLLRGRNDLLILTKFQFGNEPPVDRLHYLGSDDPVGWYGDFFRDTILSVRDLTKRELTLRLQVYDVDGIDGDLVDAVRSISTEAAALFPQLLPHAGLVGLSVGPVIELIDNVDDHDAILDDRIKLVVEEPETRHNLLQPGYVVCVDGEVPDGATLDGDLRVRSADGTELADRNYAVLEVAREFVGRREWELDQKAAKLVAELNGKGQSGKASLDFLKDTLDAYGDYQRLGRAAELRSKESLTDAERQLLDDLRADPDLRPYLGDGA